MTPDSKRRATLRTIVAAGSMLLVARGNASAQAIVKIGCVLPLTGGSAALGTQTPVGVRGGVGGQAVVKIGCVLPLGGGPAALGTQTRVGVMAAVEQINAAGGI